VAARAAGALAVSAPPRLSCRDLAVAIAGRTLAAKLDLDGRAGEIWAIVGPNGAGKTTLLATLAGLRPSAAGSIAYDGDDIGALSSRERALRRGYLPQDSIDTFPATVQEIVLAGRHPHLPRWRWEGRDDVERARDALAALDLAGLEARDVRTLSGGERRRVALAALLAQDPGLLLLDEPSTHLDPGRQVDAMDRLIALARERGKAIVMVVHELHLALRAADHAIAMGDGGACAGTADEVLNERALSGLFRHPLVAVGSGTTRTLLPR
jgi:iron complex transport system ATP-binding protein